VILIFSWLLADFFKIRNFQGAAKALASRDIWSTAVSIPSSQGLQLAPPFGVIQSHSSYTIAAKRLVDIAASLCLIIAILPLLMLIGAGLASNGGPPIYRHRRIGRDGRTFDCLKFRTMHVDADRMLAEALQADPALRDEWLASRKLRRDPRITRIGRILRTTSLDELPQLLNVLRGDMSLVGPRPVVVDEFRQHYTGSAAAAYLSVRPGITGLWQVSGRSDVDYQRRVELDAAYVRNLSLIGDLKLLLRTVLVLARRQGAY
jgi:lipopolysaccharide/colanic/teichoic acid biosynthesis glycosyltransferase